MVLSLVVPDEILIGFFTAVVLALTGAIAVLYWDGRGDRKDKAEKGKRAFPPHDR